MNFCNIKSIINNCPNVNYFFVPVDVSSTEQLNTSILANSNIQYLVFTVMNLDDSLQTKILNTNCLGLCKDCQIEFKNKDIYSYNNNNKTLQKISQFDISSYIKTLKTIESGKVPRLYLGKFSYFQKEYIEYCLQNKIPFIIIYHDSTTSIASRLFYENAIKNSAFKEKLAEFNCPIFTLDRNGFSSTDSNIYYYRNSFSLTIQNHMKNYGYTESQIQNINFRDMFCCISFIYLQDNNIKVEQFTSSLFSVDTLFSKFKSCYDNCQFNNFDSEPYQTEELDDEQVNNSLGNFDDLKTFINLKGYKSDEYIVNGNPWWINSGSVSYTNTFSFLTSLNFRCIASKEQTYVFVCGYDLAYPNADYSYLNETLVKMFSNYSNNIEYIIQGNTYKGMFLEKLKKGLTYKKFIFYEFSHGNTGIISVDKGNNVYRDDIWGVFKNAKNIIFGIFESCYSGSMITKANQNLNSNNTESISEFIVRKLNERKQNMLKSGLFTSSLSEPMIMLWSSAPGDENSHYDPMLFSNRFRPGMCVCLYENYNGKYNKTQLMTYSEYFTWIKNNPWRMGDKSINDDYQRSEYGISQGDFKIFN